MKLGNLAARVATAVVIVADGDCSPRGARSEFDQLSPDEMTRVRFEAANPRVEGTSRAGQSL